MSLFGDDDEWDFEKDFSDDEWEEDDDEDPWFIPEDEKEIEGYVLLGIDDSPVKCDLCGHIWNAPREYDTEKVECPNCEQLTFFEEIEDEEEEL